LDRPHQCRFALVSRAGVDPAQTVWCGTCVLRLKVDRRRWAVRGFGSLFVCALRGRRLLEADRRVRTPSPSFACHPCF